MELSPETNLPWALRSLLPSPTTWEMRTLGPGTWQRIFTKGEGALQWHSRVTRGLSAPLKMGKIHSPQLLCGSAKPTFKREMSILVCCQQGHPSAIFQGWWPPDNIEVASQRSNVYVEGALSPEHLRLLGAASAGRVCGKNVETMRKTNDETDGEPST